jgi:lipopolysaccharide biosynthesis glycosyltransferase
MSVGLIHVAVTTDEHYLQHAGVMLTSLFVHNPQERFVVYLVSNASEHPDYGKLKKMVTDAATGSGVTIDTRLLQYLKLTAHATTAVYYRLLIPA